jgi:hypothetical protein
MDHHVQRSVVVGLRRQGVDVLTTNDDGTSTLPDPELLDRATQLARVLVTYDQDLLAEAHRRRESGVPFSGVIFARPARVSIGACISDLTLVGLAGEPHDFAGRVVYLPL